jgi:hypothetical protein
MALPGGTIIMDVGSAQCVKECTILTDFSPWRSNALYRIRSAQGPMPSSGTLGPLIIFFSGVGVDVECAACGRQTGPRAQGAHTRPEGARDAALI